ncbi:MAG: biopolymer transporter ExbD [Flavobacteriales bacterium]|nr:biopolymer transporter ExbD [Flavobacteriales bacterium]
MGRVKRDVPEINAGSMADIAFLLLIFFLVTTTMDTDTGLIRVLPPFVEEPQDQDDQVLARNVFVVLANAADNLLVEDEYMQVEDLKEAAKEFIIGQPNNPDNLRFPVFVRADSKPEKNALIIKYFGANRPVSKQIVSLQNDRGTSYELYIAIQDQLAGAYREVRDEVAIERFGKKYMELKKSDSKLENEQAKAVRKLIPQRISEAEPKAIGE